jgi:hypothetical protein
MSVADLKRNIQKEKIANTILTIMPYIQRSIRYQAMPIDMKLALWERLSECALQLYQSETNLDVLLNDLKSPLFYFDK